MDSDLKEEEPFIDARSHLRLRGNIPSQSFGMQLQHCLEQITKLMKVYDPKNEYTTNALIEYIGSFDVNMDKDEIEELEKEQDVSLMIDFESLYSNALKTISSKERELEISRFQCRQMAQQLDKYSNNISHRADGTNDDNKEDVDEDVDEDEDDHVLSWPNALNNSIDITPINTSISDNGSANDNFESDHEDEDEDEDEDGSYYSGSDYPLISDHIMFKCPDEYEQISFIKYDDDNHQYHYQENQNKHNMDIVNDDDTESLNGIQTDWNSDESDESDIELDEIEEREEDQDEDEFNLLFQEWNQLRIKYEQKDKIVNEQRKELDEIRIRFENKCKECDELRQKLRILSGDSEPNE